MTKHEAVQRMFWRFGLVFFVLGSAGVAYEGLLVAWTRHLVHFPSRYLWWPVYGMGGFMLGGMTWMFVESVREGAMAERDLSVGADHMGPVAIIALGWTMFPTSTALDTTAALALAFCGWRSMRIASRNLGPTAK